MLKLWRRLCRYPVDCSTRMILRSRRCLIIYGAARQPASTNRAPASAEATEQTDAMEDSTLDRTIDQVVARAVWTMQKFVGHLKGTPRTVEAALAAHDLDEAIGTLLRYQRELAPLVTEYCRRQKEPVGFEQVEVPPNSQLSLLPILGG